METSAPKSRPRVVSVRTELWFAWAEIAGEQEMAAADWRAKAAADVAAGRNPSIHMALETKAAIASVAAAGAALETFGRYLRSFAAGPATDNDGATHRLLSQVRHLYPQAKVTEELARRIGKAFGRRHQSLHYASTARKMGPHPLGMSATWVARTFTVEAARLSVEAVADLITAATNPGRSPVKRAEWEASRCRNVGAAIRARTKVPLDIVP